MQVRTGRSGFGWLLIALLAVTVLVIGACSSKSSETPREDTTKNEAVPSEPKQDQKPATLRLAGAMPADFISSRAMSEVFIPEVQKKSNGLIKVEFYPAGQLFVDKDLNQAVVTGSVEMMYNTYVWWSGQAPAASFIDLPFLFKDTAQYTAAMKGKVGQELGKIVDEQGAKFLGWVHLGWEDAIGSRKPIKKLEDLQGLKIRSWGDLPAKSFDALGATSVAFSSSEVYMALQRGTIDAAALIAESFVSRKLVEVIKYLTVIPMSMMSQGIVANAKWWNSLAPDQQKIIQDAVKNVEEWSLKEMEKIHDDSIEKIRAAGVEIYVVPPEEIKRWQDKAGPVYDYYKKSGGERAARLLEMPKEYLK